MKISELTHNLTSALKLHGDLECYIDLGDEDEAIYSLEGVGCVLEDDMNESGFMLLGYGVKPALTLVT